MIKVLANDGISASGVTALEKAGFEVITQKVAQGQLVNAINEQGIAVLLVRSATKVRQDLIDACPGLKMIGRGGVGMDNIDVDYAREQGLQVINTPAASSASVAELVFAHLFGMVRFLYDANRQMPLEGESSFKDLKKAYAKGKELSGKTLGIVGFGRIGQEVAKRAIGLGMRVVAHDKFVDKANIELSFFNGEKMNFTIETTDLEDLLSQSDFVTLHIPKIDDKAVIGPEEIRMMKDGAGIINAARGGVIDEDALMLALEEGKLDYAGLDVFENEPSPSIHLLMQPNASLTPHIGAATLEAQDRIGTELADQISAFFK
jgi:D-3-phosphoglycerate dehydrogenase / 2-oxoglutarate reductase